MSLFVRRERHVLNALNCRVNKASNNSRKLMPRFHLVTPSL